MKLSEKVNSLKTVVTNLSESFDLLEQENEKMRMALRDLAVGLVPDSLPKTWTHETKMEHVAATCLMKRKDVQKPRCSI